MLVYTAVYLIIASIYRFALTEEQALSFEKFILWVRKNSKALPLTFLLGFYVSLVVKRWWEQYVKLPWPDEIATFLKVSITRTPTSDTSEHEDQENLRIRQT